MAGGFLVPLTTTKSGVKGVTMRKKAYIPKHTPKRLKGRFPRRIKGNPVGGGLSYQRNKWDWADNLIPGSTQYKTGIRELFRLNNINSPWFSQASGDALPTGHSTNDLYFDFFKVKKAKVHIEVAPNTTGKKLTLVIYFSNSTDTFDITTKSIKELSQIRNLFTYQLSTDKPFKFNRTIDIAKIEAITKQQFNSDLSNYRCAINPATGGGASAPTKLVSMAMCLINNTDTDATVSLPYECNIEYFTEYSSRKIQPQSFSV